MHITIALTIVVLATLTLAQTSQFSAPSGNQMYSIGSTMPVVFTEYSQRIITLVLYRDVTGPDVEVLRIQVNVTLGQQQNMPIVTPNVNSLTCDYYWCVDPTATSCRYKTSAFCITRALSTIPQGYTTCAVQRQIVEAGKGVTLCTIGRVLQSTLNVEIDMNADTMYYVYGAINGGSDGGFGITGRAGRITQNLPSNNNGNVINGLVFENRGTTNVEVVGQAYYIPSSTVAPAPAPIVTTITPITTKVNTSGKAAFSVLLIAIALLLQ
jgi:hypothetical protein